MKTLQKLRGSSYRGVEEEVAAILHHLIKLLLLSSSQISFVIWFWCFWVSTTIIAWMQYQDNTYQCNVKMVHKLIYISSNLQIQEVILVTSSNGREGGSLIQRWIPSLFWLSRALSERTRNLFIIKCWAFFGPRWKQRTFLQPLGILVVLMFLIALNGVDCPLNFYGPSMFSQFGWNSAH